MTRNYAHETGLVMGAVIANGPSLGAVIDGFLIMGPDGPEIPADRQAEMVTAFAETLAKGCVEGNIFAGLKVGMAFATLAGQPWTLEPLFEGIIAVLTPHIPTYRNHVALAMAEPVGFA